MPDERFLGRIYRYDPKTNILSIKVDFIDDDQQNAIEQLTLNQDLFTFSFKKPFRQSKQYFQLKYYFSLLKKILIKLDVYPEAKNIKALDDSIKRTCMKCDLIQIGDSQIPVIKSKADYSFDEMEHLNKIVEERYARFLT